MDNPSPLLTFYHSRSAAAKAYRDARAQLGISQDYLASLTGINLVTIKRRESGEAEIKPEAMQALLWMQANPPPPMPHQTPRRKSAVKMNYKAGDKFGLFTITEVQRVKSVTGVWKNALLCVRCECGTERPTLTRNLKPSFLCGKNCPARAAMAARGSYIDAYGDIIDKDGFPES